MFKKFSPKEDVSTQNQVKSSIQRGIRCELEDEVPCSGRFGLLDFLRRVGLSRCVVPQPRSALHTRS